MDKAFADAWFQQNRVDLGVPANGAKVLIDDTPFTVRREDVLSKCGWSPFEGTTFHSRIAATWVNGALVWDGEKLRGDARGRRLEFAR